MRTGNENMQWKIISETELCVFVFCMGGWTTVFVHGKISGSGCGWKTATLSHPHLDLVSTHSCFIWITYITTHTGCSEAASKKGRKQGKWKRGERESKKGGRWALKGLSCSETLRCSLPFLRTVEKLSLQGGERQAGARRRTHTHACDTSIRCVSWMHYCMLFHGSSWGFVVVIKKSLSCVKSLHLWAAVFITDVWKVSEQWGIAKLMTELVLSLLVI